jgi:hypothetical protein
MRKEVGVSYRDELIRRLQETKTWDQLTEQGQNDIKNLTDDECGRVMATADEWDMGIEPASEPTTVLLLIQLTTSFEGILVEHEGNRKGQLSKAGRMLAEFFQEVYASGLSSDEVADGLRKLSPEAIATLITIYKGPSARS